jgi:hypothetical protein
LHILSSVVPILLPVEVDTALNHLSLLPEDLVSAVLAGPFFHRHRAGTWSVCCALTVLFLFVSPAAQWHETIHERLPQPCPGWGLQLCGQWKRAPPRGQSGTPSVQPYWLEEEKARTHEGQPACESQQIMAPGCAHPQLPGGLGHFRGTKTSIQHLSCRPECLPRPPLITLHVPLCGGRVHLPEQLLVLICEALLNMDVCLPAQSLHPPQQGGLGSTGTGMCSCGFTAAMPAPWWFRASVLCLSQQQRSQALFSRLS